MKTLASTALCVLLTTTVAACANSTNDKADGSSSPSPSASPTPQTTPLAAAYEFCSASPGKQTLSFADAGHTVIIDTESEYGSIDGADCLFRMLETSQAVTATVDSTTALMGVQQADDGGLHYQWSYHPDNGLNMVITDGAQ